MLYVYSSSDTFTIPNLEPENQSVSTEEKTRIESAPLQGQIFDVRSELKKQEDIQNATTGDIDSVKVQTEIDIQYQNDIVQKREDLRVDWIEQVKRAFMPEPTNKELYRELTKVSREIELCRSSQ